MRETWAYVDESLHVHERQVLQRLLWALDQSEIRTVLLERRDPAGDHQDQRLVDVLRIQGYLPDELSVQWGDPLAEPLLWLPDLLAGAGALAEIGQDRYLTIMASGITSERFVLD